MRDGTIHMRQIPQCFKGIMTVSVPVGGEWMLHVSDVASNNTIQDIHTGACHVDSRTLSQLPGCLFDLLTVDRRVDRSRRHPPPSTLFMLELAVNV